MVLPGDSIPLVGDLEFAAIDFESAGKSSEPIQIGIAILCKERLVQQSLFRSYLQTHAGIDWHAQKVHGITKSDLQDAPSLRMLWSEIKERLTSRWVVAHGSGTEKRYLRVFPLHPFGPWVDTLNLTRALFPNLGSYALGDLAMHFELDKELKVICPDFYWHDALYDAMASLFLLRFLIRSAGLQDQPAQILLRPDTSSYVQQVRSRKR